MKTLHNLSQKDKEKEEVEVRDVRDECWNTTGASIL